MRASWISRRKLGGGLLLAMVIGTVPLAAAAAQTKSIVMLDFEIIDNTTLHAKDEEQKARLAMISQQLRQAFAEKNVYQVLDPAPAAPLIAELKNRFELHTCNGCDIQIGQALGADRVLTGWVQKVSNLILNINIRVRDVKTESVVLVKSVDIRGNNDTSWRRGIDYMMRSIVEKHQENR